MPGEYYRSGVGYGANADRIVWAMPSPTRASIQLVGVPICPDLLRYEQIGAADNLRGRVVRAFFWLMRWWS